MDEHKVVVTPAPRCRRHFPPPSGASRPVKGVASAEASRCWLVCYDVENDEARDRFSRLLSAHGERVQYSVFLCWLTGHERMKLMQALQHVGMASPDAGTRDLRLYPVLRSNAVSGASQPPLVPAGYWLV